MTGKKASEIDLVSDKKIVFICGLHRSGTSILHKVISSSTDVSGFQNTNVPKDEGQHLQSVFKPAKAYGGPGKFAFNTNAYLDEESPLVNEVNKRKLTFEWSKHWDTSKKVLVEKSPPNLIRTRFLQAFFPNAYFITIVRHPLAVTYATQKWSHTPVKDLLNHWLIAHQKFFRDKPHIKNNLVFSYEEMIANPKKIIDKIESFLDIKIDYQEQFEDKNINYFKVWEKKKWWKFSSFLYKSMLQIENEEKVKSFGYSLNDLKLYAKHKFFEHKNF